MSPTNPPQKESNDHVLREMMEEVIELESDLKKNKEAMAPLLKDKRAIAKRKRQLLSDISVEHEARGVLEVTYHGYVFGVSKKPRLTLKKDDVLEALGPQKDQFVAAHTSEVSTPYVKEVS